jgi:hypothetical protein
LVTEFDDYETMDKFFSAFMMEQKPALSDVVQNMRSVRLDYGGTAAGGVVAGNEAAAGVAAV